MKFTSDDAATLQRIADLFAQSNAAAAAAYPDADRDACLALKLAGLNEAPEHLAVFSVPDPAAGLGLGRQTMPETVVYSTVMATYALWLTARAENLGLGWVSILDPQAAAATLDAPSGSSWAICASVTPNSPMTRRCCTAAAGSPIPSSHG